MTSSSWLLAALHSNTCFFFSEYAFLADKLYFLFHCVFSCNLGDFVAHFIICSRRMWWSLYLKSPKQLYFMIAPFCAPGGIFCRAHGVMQTIVFVIYARMQLPLSYVIVACYLRRLYKLLIASDLFYMKSSNYCACHCKCHLNFIINGKMHRNFMVSS